MAALTLAELDADIASCRSAIRACESGMQSVNKTGLSYTRVQYNQLTARLRELLTMRQKMDSSPAIASDVSGASSLTPEGSFNDADAT